jgi:predicted PurR-regulated permease PerM
VFISLSLMMMCMQWMEDFEAFQAAVSSDQSYTSTLTESLSLVLDEFYKNLRSVGVSAVSGAGMEAFFNAIEASAEEYMETYKYCLNLINVFLGFFFFFFALSYSYIDWEHYCYLND